MKRILVTTTALALVLSSVTFAGKEEKAPQLELKSPSAKLSYALGLEIGSSLKRIQTNINLAAFVRGLEDMVKGRTPLLTPQQATAVKKDFFAKMKAVRARKSKALTEKNGKAESSFLAQNKKKKGVTTTASGLQYIVLRPGKGPSPKLTDRVTVNYRGSLINGTVFDSSYKRGKPVTFPVKGVIPGWTEALQLMKVGSKYRLFIPSDLAYGKQGAGPHIGPNSLLIFEVELLAINK